MNETITLTGTTIRHSWDTNPFSPGGPNPSFVTVICDDQTLVWNNITDPDNPMAEKEHYVRTDLAEGLVQVSWRESPDTTNFAVIWTLDFNTQRIYGVLVNVEPTRNFNVVGRFTQTPGTEVSAPLRGC